MQLRLLGWAADGPRLDLDHERFAYAGNFGTGRTGIAVALRDDADDDGAEPSPDAADVLAAASFDRDRAADAALRVRYVSVREDRRGEGIGPRLLGFVVERALDADYERVRIGVNNPIAYRAAYAAGFGFTSEESGVGELVLEAPRPDESGERYRDGLERFADRDLPQVQRDVLERHREDEPPEPVGD